MKLLIVEDEVLLSDSLQTVLTGEGFDVDAVYDGEMGLLYGARGIYDLIILDVMLPQMDGCEAARQLRARHIGTPILMLTARSGLEDRITGLNAGADYYLPKPFDIRELLACVNALLRRQGSQINELTCGNTTLDLDSAALLCGGNRIQLSAREFEVIHFLFQSPSRIIPKEAILEKVWGFDSNASENHVEVYIGFLRKKLLRLGSNVSIRAIRGLGYRLEAET